MSLAQAIIEDQPSRPSTVLTESDQRDDRSGDEISESRKSTLVRLRRRLKGDLDNIALMALRKEPERRYASARALHDDIDRATRSIRTLSEAKRANPINRIEPSRTMSNTASHPSRRPRSGQDSRSRTPVRTRPHGL